MLGHWSLKSHGPNVAISTRLMPDAPGDLTDRFHRWFETVAYPSYARGVGAAGGCRFTPRHEPGSFPDENGPVKLPPLSTLVTQMMPTEILGWKAQADDESYDGDSIFDYLDGAGEVFRCYGFRRLLVRRFVRPAQPDIVIELFDMGSSQDAFGVFTHCRIESSAGNIGQDSTYQAGLLSFWKSRYYVSVATERETPEARETVLAMGRSIADSIGTDGSRPPLLNCLPADGLIGSSVRFFHTHVSLNYHYFVAEWNILNLNNYTDVVLARYEPIDSRMYLLGVQYPGQQQAKAAFDSFIKAYLPEATRRAIVETENGKWTAARRKGKRVLIAFDAPTERRASSLLEAAEASVEVKHS